MKNNVGLLFLLAVVTMLLGQKPAKDKVVTDSNYFIRPDSNTTPMKISGKNLRLIDSISKISKTNDSLISGCKYSLDKLILQQKIISTQKNSITLVD